MAYKQFKPEELILRDELALDRTLLANERTLLAYLRTAIMLLVTGGTVLKFLDKSPVNAFAAWCIIALGLAVAILGLLRFLRVRRSLDHLASREEGLKSI